ncbi:hypothetical protein BN1723_015997 [Verticillium longisporum]|uniref:Uncharacterized protein n=1 Tax=Verticillium longisporum TaxID=100787 RepID=A0A0G4N6I4_VERLO|nr:hypothetical protein BN1723_015997 [Verticillium longisporum]
MTSLWQVMAGFCDIASSAWPGNRLSALKCPSVPSYFLLQISAAAVKKREAHRTVLIRTAVTTR